MFRKSLVALMALSVAACAKPYVGVPYTATAEPIENIGIIDDSMSDSASAREAASVMGNFGLIGALIDAVDQGNRKNKVNDALATVDYKAEDNFEQFLVEEFAAADINAAVIEGADRPKREFVKEYPTVAPETQALLDVNVTYYGYANPGGTTWRPTVSADVKLVDAETKATLMENRMFYNPIDAQEGVITIPPGPEYGYDDRNEMAADPEGLAAGIDMALREIAKTIVSLMK